MYLYIGLKHVEEVETEKRVEHFGSLCSFLFNLMSFCQSVQHLFFPLQSTSSDQHLIIALRVHYHCMMKTTK